MDLVNETALVDTVPMHAESLLFFQIFGVMFVFIMALILCVFFSLAQLEGYDRIKELQYRIARVIPRKGFRAAESVCCGDDCVELDP